MENKAALEEYLDFFSPCPSLQRNFGFEENGDLPAPKLWINPEIKNFYDFDNSKDLKDIISPNAARAVLAGIVTDTGRFTFKNTRPETLETAGHLIDLGGDISEVCYNLFDRKTKAKFLLSAKARSEVQFFCDGKFALTVVPYSQFKEFGAGPDGVMLYQPCATSTALNSLSY